MLNAFFPKPSAGHRVPCIFMRGGTSRGPFFLASDLPSDIPSCDAVLISVMGSPGGLQINGLGGAHPLTSKVAIVSPSAIAGVDVDYTFAQVLVEKAAVDRMPNCGNMLSGVGPFAIEAGLVPAGDPETKVRIRNTNTNTTVDVVVQTPGGIVEYEGNAKIDGVPGTAAPVRLLFSDAVGAITGSLLPTGAPTTMIEGIETTLIDGAIPVVILRAEDVGLRGDESASQIDELPILFEKIERVRRLAGKAMGMGEVSGQVVPKVAIISTARNGGTLTVRYLTPDRCHKTLAVTGAVTLAMSLLVPGSLPNQMVQPITQGGEIAFEHPEGAFFLDVETIDAPEGLRIKRLSTVRTARRIFEGQVIVPLSVWPFEAQSSELQSQPVA